MSKDKSFLPDIRDSKKLVHYQTLCRMSKYYKNLAIFFFYQFIVSNVFLYSISHKVWVTNNRYTEIYCWIIFKCVIYPMKKVRISKFIAIAFLLYNRYGYFIYIFSQIGDVEELTFSIIINIWALNFKWWLFSFMRTRPNKLFLRILMGIINTYTGC